MSIQQEQLNKWQRLGHEPMWDRGTVRLREFKRTLPRDLDVTVLDKRTGQYVPFMLPCGRPLKCGEVLPERADLALDDEGHLLSQADFEQRYDIYLAAFVYPSGSDLAFEPVPNVVQYVSEMPDPWSESKGMVTIGTPRDTGEFVPKARFGPNGETEEEWLKESQKNVGDIASAMSKIVELQTQMAAFLMERNGPVPNPAPPVIDEPAGMDSAEAVEAVGQSTEEIAPCGKKIRRGYLAQHQRFCNSEDCGGKGENTTGPEAA